MEGNKRAGLTTEEISAILVSTAKADWNVSDEMGAYTYKQDSFLRIQMHPIDYRSVADRFYEAWATKHPDTDQKAYRAIYDVFYGDSFITQKVLVCVDGGRAILPMPRHGTNVIPYEEYLFARIVSPDSMEEYIDRFGLTVELK